MAPSKVPAPTKTLTQTVQPCLPQASGLVAWWPGDGNAQDVAGGNNGVLQNGTAFALGKVMQAFSFDGVDDEVSVADSWAQNTLLPQLRIAKDNRLDKGLSATSNVSLGCLVRRERFTGLRWRGERELLGLR